MRHLLPTLIILAGLHTTGWAASEADAPADTGDSVQQPADSATDIESGASRYANRSEMGARIRAAVQKRVAEAIENNPNIDEADKKEILEGLKSAPADIDMDHRIGFGETVVATVAIILTVGMPILIVVAVLFASYRKRRIVRDMVSQFLANDQPVPPEVWHGLAGDSSPQNHLRQGMLLLGLGLGVFLCFWLMGSLKAAYLAMIPLFIGIAQLLIWALEKNKASPGA